MSVLSSWVTVLSATHLLRRRARRSRQKQECPCSQFKESLQWSFACGLTKWMRFSQSGLCGGSLALFPGDLHLCLPVVFHTKWRGWVHADWTHSEHEVSWLTGMAAPPFIIKSDESASRTIGHASCCAVQLYIRLSASSVERHRVQCRSIHTHTPYMGRKVGGKRWCGTTEHEIPLKSGLNLRSRSWCHAAAQRWPKKIQTHSLSVH